MHLIGEVSRTRLRPSYSKPWSKACREKSAKVIVPAEDSGREGLNPTEVNNHKRYRMKGALIFVDEIMEPFGIVVIGKNAFNVISIKRN